MAPRFPEIVDCGSALDFALSAEEACGDVAKVARELAPLPYWHAMLEELIDEHRERIERLAVVRQKADKTLAEPVRSLAADDYLGPLTVAPGGWPDVIEQAIAAEDAAARYHDDFATRCDDALGGGAHDLRKCAKQDRRAAEELRAMLAR